MGEEIVVPPSVAHAGPVLVTGAGGFVGANVVWGLRQHGLAVRALVRRPPRGPQWQDLDGVEFVLGDVRDARRMAEITKGVGFVVHAAALTELIPKPRREAFRVNVEGTRNVCAAALAAGVRRLIHLSSACTVARGTADQPADESSPYNLGAIRAPYYTTKRQAERVALEFHGRGLETICLCPAYVVGPRDVRPTTNQLILHLARTAYPVIGPGGMNFIDVREVALAHVRALWLGEAGTRYLLAGPYLSYPDLGRLVQAIQGTNRPVRVLPSWVKPLGSSALVLAPAFFAPLPEGLSLPAFQYSFLAVHTTGQRADRDFKLTHRPMETTIRDTLRWFEALGQAL